MGGQNVICRSDSQLMVGHMKGEYQVKDPLLLRYYHKVLNIMESFNMAEIIHISREHNTKVDSLSKLTSQQRQVQHNFIIQQTLHSPTVGVENFFTVTTKKDDWIRSYKEVIKNKEQGIETDGIMARKAANFILIGDELNKRGFSIPLLKCLSQEQSEHVI